MGRFALNLKEIRKAHKKTQEELAKALGVSRSTIGMYESGAREPDFETLEAIADYFNVSMDDLAGGSYLKREDDMEVWREELRANPDLRMLLSASSKLNEDDIKYLIQLAERMNRE